MFFVDVAQQALLAQQPALQAFWLEALERIQVRADTPTGAANSAATTTTESMILLNIQFSYNTK
jgi:hypothetical protein